MTHCPHCGVYLRGLSEQHMRDLTTQYVLALALTVFFVVGAVAAPPAILLAIAGIYVLAKDLNVLLLGSEEAAHLGVNVARVELGVYILASLLTGIAVSTSGAIGYLGLLVPHLGRMLVGNDHRLLLPTAALGGAILLVLSDTLARTALAPSELPVGAVTAVAGAPVFIYLLRKTAG